jgi:hypothetical protein
MKDDRYVESNSMDKVYLVQKIDGNGYPSYYGPYFDIKVAHRLISGWKAKRSDKTVAMKILTSETDWKEI